MCKLQWREVSTRELLKPNVANATGSETKRSPSYRHVCIISGPTDDTANIWEYLYWRVHARGEKKTNILIHQPALHLRISRQHDYRVASRWLHSILCNKPETHFAKQIDWLQSGGDYVQTHSAPWTFPVNCNPTVYCHRQIYLSGVFSNWVGSEEVWMTNAM